MRDPPITGWALIVSAHHGKFAVWGGCRWDYSRRSVGGLRVGLASDPATYSAGWDLMGISFACQIRALTRGRAHGVRGDGLQSCGEATEAGELMQDLGGFFGLG